VWCDDDDDDDDAHPAIIVAGVRVVVELERGDGRGCKDAI
jgi:hypothetical protein